MVSNIALPSHQAHTSARNQVQAITHNAHFPLSSPPIDEISSLKSAKQEKTFDRHNPFSSPDLSESGTTDSEGGSSSGQDEFHLDRYSPSAKRRLQNGAEISRKESRTRTRPGLNVITQFPTSQAKALGPNVRVEEVRAKKTAAKSRPKSVISAKAEHFYQSGSGRRVNPLAGVRNLTSHGNEKKKQRTHHQHEQYQPTDHPVSRIELLRDQQSREESPVKPVLIGISVPQHEADAHNLKAGHESAFSLLTPGTPAIIVTPAEDDALWNRPASSDPGAASNAYSVTTHAPGAHLDRSNAPPVPKVPNIYGDFANRPTDRIPGPPKSILVRRDSFESIEYDSPEDPQHSNHREVRRDSNESQERILASGGETARPKSQGWWNLMLSPMLSRAGTIKSAFNRSSPEDAQVPPLPTGPSKRLSRSTTFESEPSPETPRRIGMASARASTWSRWTTWEKQRNQDRDNTVARDLVSDGHANNPEVNLFGPIANAAAISGIGLGAEYFHACAIEQLSTEPYFDCENHSCSEKLPKLQSIFDRQFMADANNPTAEANRSKDAVPVLMPDPSHQRALSASTQAISEPDELSPNVRQADMATIGKAKAVDSPNLKATSIEEKEKAKANHAGFTTTDALAEPAPIPMPSPPRPQTRYPNIAAIVPPPSQTHSGPVLASPGPISPEAQRTMAPQDALQMSEMQREPQQINYYNQFHYPQREVRTEGQIPAHVNNEGMKESPQVRQAAVARDDASEKAEDEKAKKPGLLSRLKQCAKVRKARNAVTNKQSKKKWWAMAIFITLLLMIIGSIVLATQLTRRGDGTPTQQQWLNLTGYPPMPTGISTIIRPDTVKTQSQCVAPNMWSCALPKENQDEIAPNNPDQPNFRFAIKFKNGTVPSNMTIPLRRRISDPFSNDLFTPSPAPPSRADQIFMGNTTDNVTEPFDGEETPFFMTFIPAFPINPNDPAVTGNTTSSRLKTRQQSQNLADAIPPPDIQSDGSAAPANLLPTQPFPFSQPIRLYNRGQQTEHYGFYMYYDKAIFLSSNAANLNETSEPTAEQNAQDANGGSLRSQAQARCTFSQTRFLVQIFTNPSFGGNLLGAINPKVNSAINYTPPGSFPYPATITVDRHGGNVNKKAAYCYGVDGLQVIRKDVKAVVAEVRGVGGQLINAAPSLFEVDGKDNGFDQEAGGIDGGTGGCECVWQNWN